MRGGHPLKKLWVEVDTLMQILRNAKFKWFKWQKNLVPGMYIHPMGCPHLATISEVSFGLSLIIPLG